MSLTIQNLPPGAASVGNAIGVRFTTTGDYVDLVLQEETSPGVFVNTAAVSRAYPDAGNAVTWDIRSMLEPYVAYNPPAYPGVVGIDDVTHAEYKLRVVEYTAGAQSDALTIAGIHAYAARMAAWQGQAYESSYLGTSRFLTDQPRTKPVSQAQPEWLAAIVPQGESTVRFRGQVFLKDGSSAFFGVGPVLNVEDYDLVRAEVGYLGSGLGAVVGEIDYWQVWLGDGSGAVLTEKMTYSLSCVCSELDRFFVFENGLGGWDTLRATGPASLGISTEGEQAELLLSPFASPTARRVQDYNTRSRYSVEQASGHLPLETRVWLARLMESESVFRLGDTYPNPSASGELRPINLERGDVGLIQDREYLGGVKFRYRELRVG